MLYVKLVIGAIIGLLCNIKPYSAIQDIAHLSSYCIGWTSIAVYWHDITHIEDMHDLNSF